ncbi:hypothetical protein D6764_01510 [Candidatus Woesearchaeota archaeon]|nr:MAG: hypothetical protein D6764_01510 [Candidatus Woesearchaeota archaeon]
MDYEPENNKLLFSGKGSIKRGYSFLVLKDESQPELDPHDLGVPLEEAGFTNKEVIVRHSRGFTHVHNQLRKKEKKTAELRFYFACKPEARVDLTVFLAKHFNVLDKLRSFKFNDGTIKRNDNLVVYFYQDVPHAQINLFLNLIEKFESDYKSKNGTSAFDEYLIPPFASRQITLDNRVVREIFFIPYNSSGYGGIKLGFSFPESYKGALGVGETCSTPNMLKGDLVYLLLGNAYLEDGVNKRAVPEVSRLVSPSILKEVGIWNNDGKFHDLKSFDNLYHLLLDGLKPYLQGLRFT